MEFDFTKEQLKLQRMVRDFVNNECTRQYQREIDKTEKFPHDLWEKMSKLGFMAYPVPKEYGGKGGNIIDEIIIIEELARGMATLATPYQVNAFAGAVALSHFGTEEQKREYLPRLADGNIFFAFSVTEPAGGQDILGVMSTSAVADGDDYVITGRKIFTTGADIADYILVVVRTKPIKDVDKKALGISMFLVPRESPGLKIRPLPKLGVRGISTCTVFYNNVRVPKMNLLGELDRGWYQLLTVLNNERITTAACCIGVAQAAYEDALRYAKRRVAFGKPIGAFQSIQHKLADSALELELARLIMYKAAWLQANGRPCGLEATMAKQYASEIGVFITTRGMDILAGYGFILNNNMQRYLRDIRQYVLGPITNQISRNFIGESIGLPRAS